MNEKSQRVLQYIAENGSTTVDEFVSTHGFYVNSWAPTFTHLRKYGLLRRTGEKRKTSHGSEAFVLALTQDGREELEECLIH